MFNPQHLGLGRARRAARRNLSGPHATRRGAGLHSLEDVGGSHPIEVPWSVTKPVDEAYPAANHLGLVRAAFEVDDLASAHARLLAPIRVRVICGLNAPLVPCPLTGAAR